MQPRPTRRFPDGSRVVTRSIAAALLAASAAAQCQPQWGFGRGTNGFDGFVFAATPWDRDGTGPQPPVVAFGGTFTLAGYLFADRVVVWDPATALFSPLGSGFDGPVDDLLALPNGELVAAGTFTTAGGVPAANIARWNGSSWVALGSGVGGQVHSVARLANGDLLAGGGFATAGGVPASNVARWNGTAWSAVGAGTDGFVSDLEVLPNGDVAAAGLFTQAGGAPAAGIARWNGASWSPLGAGVAGAAVNLHVTPAGELLVGGFFSAAGGQPAANIARWNGSVWSPLGGGVGGLVFAVTTLSNGDVLAAGGFTSAGGLPAGYVARWDGSAWTAFGGGTDGPVGVLTQLGNGDVVAGGFFTAAGGVPARFVARFTGSQWVPLWQGCDGVVRAAASDGFTQAWVGGTFTSFGNFPANHVTYGGSSIWFSPGQGTNGPVLAIAARPNEAFVGGAFDTAGSFPSLNVARWDGVAHAWSPLGPGLAGTVTTVQLVGNDLYAGGAFTSSGALPVSRVARWDGSSWWPLGSGVDDDVHALAAAGGPSIVVGGRFLVAGGVPRARIARWDVSAAVWQPLGAGITDPNGEVNAIAVLGNGDVIAGGSFASAGGIAAANIARWDGASWSPLGGLAGSGCNDTVRSLTVLPDGDVVVGGDFTSAGGVPCAFLARWNGTSFAPFGLGTDGPVHATAWHGNTPLDQGLLVGGAFTRAGGAVAVAHAQLTTPCPPSADTFGFSCPHSSGTAVLSPMGLPWTGTTFLARGFGLPANAIVVTVLGFNNGPVPMSLVLPIAGPNCFLLASPDALLLGVPVAGIVDLVLAIPDNPSLAGLMVSTQMVTLELGPAFSVVHASNTNAVLARPGTF